jgi:hemolysin III
MTGLVAVLVYGFGLLGMLLASALFNLTPPGRPKAIFRLLDHSMILVMIAGSYTPFAMEALRPPVGVPLACVIWALAAIGIFLQLARPALFARVSLGLYLCMGWVVVGVFPFIMAALSVNALALLIAGGVIYSVGSVIHTRGTMPFHNPVWHAMVVVAAALHFCAVATLFQR